MGPSAGELSCFEQDSHKPTGLFSIFKLLELCIKAEVLDLG